jgi:eukaryotic-like serine/threonine-protein kinase
MYDVCAGVGVAHRQGLLHRDLKPDNVIVVPPVHEGDEETAKVVDFGLAKVRDVAASTALTHQGAVIGTLYYMSPEQCSGEEVDARADVYSLGAMFYEMLTGGPPFRSNSLAGLIAKHLHEPAAPFPSSLGVPLPLESVCLRAPTRRVILLLNQFAPGSFRSFFITGLSNSEFRLCRVIL